MTQKPQSDELLNTCIQAAIELGFAKAEGTDTPDHFTALKNAMTEYIDSERTKSPLPTLCEGELENLMIKNAYLTYLYALGKLSIEQLPEMFQSLNTRNS
jgi:hypothetical protein